MERRDDSALSMRFDWRLDKRRLQLILLRMVRIFLSGESKELGTALFQRPGDRLSNVYTGDLFER